ncbi:MAG: AmmeMemoRadiSam system protein B [Desulfobulbus sp.]|jgi:AmmeMemoRadiSam system protein B
MTRIMTRMPAVDGRFYPADPKGLQAMMEQLVPARPAEELEAALAVVLPHAGYVYSGAVAGKTISRVRVPESVLLLGPNHHGRGAAVALDTRDWRMPWGLVPCDRELADLLVQKAPMVREDHAAHAAEHSLEVQLPFLYRMQPKLAIAPLVIGRVDYPSCRETASALACAIRALNRPVLVVASTDMSHYLSRREAMVLDRLAIDHVLALDPEGLYQTVVQRRISMCGVIPTTIALLIALELGARQAELVEYTDSGAVSGDTAQVVGYAGVIIR